MVSSNLTSVVPSLAGWMCSSGTPFSTLHPPSSPFITLHLSLTALQCSPFGVNMSPVLLVFFHYLFKTFIHIIPLTSIFICWALTLH